MGEREGIITELELTRKYLRELREAAVSVLQNSRYIDTPSGGYYVVETPELDHLEELVKRLP